jgi:hypothetical protein
VLRAYNDMAVWLCGALQVVRIHESGERNGLATAVMEQAAALTNLASALLVVKKYKEAREKYLQALEVRAISTNAEA